MPHFTTDMDRATRSMTSSSALSLTGASRSYGSGPNGVSAMDNKWRRASLPAADVYSDYNGGRGRSGSIISNTSNVTTSRRQLYHPTATSKDAVLKESPLIAELRTNVIIKNEYALVTDLSYHLAARYSKPDSSIMINIDHSACLALGGTFDPCYILTITAIPSAFDVNSNKRNASLIQSFVADILSVPPDRGIIRFNSVAEENYASNGNTIDGQLDRFDDLMSTESVRRTMPDARNNNLSSRKSAVDMYTHRVNGGATASDREQRTARRRSTLNDDSGEVFELPADDDARPSSRATSTAEAPLRSSPSSRENLKRETSRHTRPRTVTAQSQGVTSADTFTDARSQVKPKHISTVIKAEQKNAHMPTTIRTSRSNGTVPARTHSFGAKSLNSSTPTPVTLKETFVDNPKVLEADAKTTGGDAAANKAKRTSSITATPKLPTAPPIPESKTPRVNKRKSFLSAFRR